MLIAKTGPPGQNPFIGRFLHPEADRRHGELSRREIGAVRNGKERNLVKTQRGAPGSASNIEHEVSALVGQSPDTARQEATD
jgi:hypothetical protein